MFDARARLELRPFLFVEASYFVDRRRRFPGQERDDSFVICRFLWRKEHCLRSGVMLSELYNSPATPLEAVRWRT